MTIPGDSVPGHVGVPLPCNKIKLVDVPGHESNGVGEVWIKGSNVFRGYYAMPERTKEVFDDASWLRTGDLGQWTERGTLKIIGRIKDLFKLTQVSSNSL